MITGRDFIKWGFQPGPWFRTALEAANEMVANGASLDEVKQAVTRLAPKPVESIPLKDVGETSYHVNIEARTRDETHNVAMVKETMSKLMQTPVLEAGAVMPDACPAGPTGTIPVGGVVKSKHIHPGMHSADVCCSVAITMCGDIDPRILLDAVQATTHFGGGGRKPGNQVKPEADLLSRMKSNPFLRTTVDVAISHHGTQGDGNHFAYVGRVRSTGQVALVTHHGSRKPGAMLYKAGLQFATGYCSERAPDTLAQNVWIEAESESGEKYWQALQLIREWTKSNHFVLHDLALSKAGAKATDRFWNEHNFVFKRGDYFYHAKGATPAWADFAPDSSGLTLIPLNMAQPILITRGRDAENGLGFCPHGAGRNMSRSEHRRRTHGLTVAELVEEETADIDVRFFSGFPDETELPSAYKDAAEIVRQIDQFGLADVVDHVDPYGCIMAGDWKKLLWDRRAAKRASR